MSYCILDQDPTAHCALALDAASESLEPMDWLDGRARHVPTAPVTLRVHARGRLPDLDTHVVPLASPRLRAVLDAEGIANVRFRRAVLEDALARVEAEHWLFQVLGQISAVDRARSEADDYLGGPGLVLGRFAIDARRADGARLFRLAEAPHLLIADAELAGRLRAADLFGLRLRATEDHDGW